MDLYYCFIGSLGKEYTVCNTLILSTILIVSIYVIYRILKSIKIGFDAYLSISLIPYVILGSSLRVLKDANVFIFEFLVTPHIYILTFSLFFPLLLLFYFVSRDNYFKPLIVIGCIICGIVLGMIPYRNVLPLLQVTVFLIPWLFLFRFVIWSSENKIISLLHTFDATTTSVAVHFFGYSEQHPIPTLIIETLGPFSFIFVKAIVVILTLIVLDRYLKDDLEFKNFLKICIGILGAATGTRDLLRVIAMV